MLGHGNGRGAQQGVFQKTASIDWLHESVFQGTCRSKFDLHPLFPKDGRTDPAQISTEDFHPGGLWDIRIQDLAELRGVAAAWAGAGPATPVPAQCAART